jgi:hypothetical protein
MCSLSIMAGAYDSGTRPLSFDFVSIGNLKSVNTAWCMCT